MTSETPAMSEIERLVREPQEPGVAQAIATYEAVERAYVRAAAALPAASYAPTSYSTTTASM